MTIQIKHPFVSLKGDGGDATLVRPTNWNAAHTTSMDTSRLLGRRTAGVGVFEELPTSTFMIDALAATDKDTFLALLGIGAFVTGDVNFSINPAAPSGWIAYNGEGTISKAGAGGTVLAAATAQPLWEIIYNNITDTYCPVSGGRTANAVNDFNAGKTMGLPRFSGRGVIGAGTGATLSARLGGQYGGEENHTLTTAELAVHSHNNSLNDPTHFHDPYGVAIGDASSAVGGAYVGIRLNAGNDYLGGAYHTSPKLTGVSISNANAGSGTGHNNMQPFTALWVKVKL